MGWFGNFFSSIFGKKDCEICGTPAGVFGRNKTSDKHYVCDACARGLNYFTRISYLTLDEIKQRIEHEENEWQEIANIDVPKGYIYKIYNAGDFAEIIVYPERHEITINTNHMHFKNHPAVVRLADVKRYAITPSDKPEPEQITVSEHKSSDNQITGWTINIPYCDKGIRQMNLKFSAPHFSREDVHYLKNLIVYYVRLEANGTLCTELAPGSFEAQALDTASSMLGGALGSLLKGDFKGAKDAVMAGLSKGETLAKMQEQEQNQNK